DLRVAISALIEKWRRLGHELHFGIGIASGYATLGTIGFEGRFDYAAIGMVSNLASRLCDEAQPGQILISPRVLLSIENVVRVEEIGSFSLKGLRRPLGSFSPSALAVCRLTTSSRLFSSLTGMSAGLAPRRILSTISAASRN